MSTPNITVILEGGLIQDVYLTDDYGTTRPIPVTVHDYDVEGADEDRYEIHLDARDREYVEYVVDTEMAL